MAYSKLLLTVEKLVLANPNKIFWSDDRKWRVKDVENKLNDERMKLDEAMQKIRDEFHKEYVEKKVDEFKFFRAIEKETKYWLNK